MRSIWLWVLVPTVVLFYVAFQLSAVGSRMMTLEDRVARMELRWATEDSPAAEPSTPLAGADSGLHTARGTAAAAGPGDESELLSLRQEVAALRAELGPAGDRRIREVLARQQDEQMDKQLDYQRDQWIAARDDALADFAVKAQLNGEQRAQMKTLMDREIEQVVELLRQRDLRTDPRRLGVAWDEVLVNTDYEVRGLLSDWQQERWEEARAFERAVFLPFLPR